MATEGGHIGFAPTDAQELAALQRMWKEHSRVSVERILAGAPPGLGRAELLGQLEAATDPRIERYWELTAVISGRGPFPSIQPALEWLAAALREPGR